VHVFVYGTLTDPARVAEVLEPAATAGHDGGGEDGSEDEEARGASSSWSFAADATLRGLHRVDGRYPTLAPGGRVDGRLLRTDAIAALDAYEGVDRGLYARVLVPYADDGTVDAGVDAGAADDPAVVWVYVGDPERLDADDAVAWPGEGDLGRRVRRYVAATDVVVEPR